MGRRENNDSRILLLCLFHNTCNIESPLSEIVNTACHPSSAGIIPGLLK